MKYGRTLIELIVAQAAILTAFVVAPINLIESLGAAGSLLLTSAIAAAVATGLYLRHRARGRRRFERKLEALRHLPVA